MRKYITVSGIIFAFVAIMHAIRLIFGWYVQVGTWSIPVWFSWGGLVAAGLMSCWAFSRLKK